MSKVRSPHAQALATPLFRQRVKPGKKRAQKDTWDEGDEDRESYSEDQDRENYT